MKWRVREGHELRFPDGQLWGSEGEVVEIPTDDSNPEVAAAARRMLGNKDIHLFPVMPDEDAPKPNKYPEPFLTRLREAGFKAPKNRMVKKTSRKKKSAEIAPEEGTEGSD
jgi:hypothetical protein